MKYKISVIVPVYKVERYLSQCIDSILNQTYRNLEIILIDDGSPDTCGQICDKWAEQDDRIIVIHKENGGLSDARNAGLSIATGEYIGFVDSDDWISLDMYELLLTEMCKTQSDISACGVEMIWENGEKRMLTRDGCLVLDNHQAMEALLDESWLKQPVWYKLYKREMVDGFYFDKGKNHEDVFWSYKPVSRAKRIVVFDKPCYFYRQRPDSIMGEKFSVKRLDSLEAMTQRIAFLRKEYPDLEQKALLKTYFYCMYLMQLALRENHSNIVCKLNVIAKEYRPNNNARISGKECLWLAMSKVSLIWTCRIRNFLKIGI